MTDDRRLIEELLPVRAISYEATREKLLRRRDHHISMLHHWWARRPLAAARAAVYATLVPSADRPGDPGSLAAWFKALCSWDGKANFGAPIQPVAQAREDVLVANGGVPPKVLDCFAGGGAIPLEVSRLGGQAFATELNPVAYLLLLSTLVYPQTFGPSLADDVEKWGTWLVERAKADLGDLYPGVPLPGGAEEGTLDGIGSVGGRGVPVAYLWTRTVACPHPSLPPHDLHLVRQTWLRKKEGKYAALRPVVDEDTLTVRYELVEATTEEGLGFDPATGSTRGSATCRACGASVSADDVKIEGKAGRIGRALLGLAYVVPGKRGKRYLGSLDAADFVPTDDRVDARLDTVVSTTGLAPPDNELTLEDPRGIWAPLYGLTTVASLFSNRQMTTLLTVAGLIRDAREEMVAGGMDEERARATATYLALALDRVADRSSTLCRWHNTGEKTEGTFSRQALPMVWDYSETNPFSPSSGSLPVALDQVVKVIRHCAATGEPATVVRQSATEPVEGGPFDAVITDPPYYDNISYADLSLFFYAWLQRSVGHLYPEHFSAPGPPTRREIVAAPYRHDGATKKERDQAAMAFYDDLMAEVFCQRREEMKPHAPLVVVYAHQTYAGWATLINALRRSGFVVVEAWPLDTEMPTRAVGQNAASLASSIFLVARRREEDRTGDWATDVYPELQRIVAKRVAELPEMGVSGDDLVIAAIGAGLRAYTQFATVELPNGEPLGPEQYLDEVQREVVETVLADVFGVARSGIAAVDPVTQFYVMGRFEFGSAWVEFDRANTLARGVGVELAGPSGLLTGRDALLEKHPKEKSKVRLRDFSARGKLENLGALDVERGSRPPLIDVLHRALTVAADEPHKVRGVVEGSGTEPSQLRLVAQALTGETLERKGSGTTPREQTAIASLLASWKRLVEARRTDQPELS